jgi:hypothetical protein
VVWAGASVLGLVVAGVAWVLVAGALVLALAAAGVAWVVVAGASGLGLVAAGVAWVVVAGALVSALAAAAAAAVPPGRQVGALGGEEADAAWAWVEAPPAASGRVMEVAWPLEACASVSGLAVVAPQAAVWVAALVCVCGAAECGRWSWQVGRRGAVGGWAWLAGRWA